MIRIFSFSILSQTLREWSLRRRLKQMYQQSLRRQQVLGPHVKAILTEGWNGKLLISPTDVVMGRQLAFEGNYNQESINYHLSYLTNQSRVLVVGAHVGSLLIPIAKKAAWVVGIEANPLTYDLLKMNILINDLSNVELYNFAAGNNNQIVDFIMNVSNSGGSKVQMGMAFNEESIYKLDSPALANVEMKRLDQALASKAFDLVIMDIEGSEYTAMQGMNEILTQTQHLQIEICPLSIRDIAQIAPDQLAQVLKKYFTHVIRLDNRNKIYQQDDFEPLITTICEYQNTVDLVFQK